MNKILFVIWLCFYSLILHADTIAAPAVVNEKNKTIPILVDRDQRIENRKFKANFKEPYLHQSEFDYSSAAVKDSFWSRLKKRVLHWLDSIFNVRVGEKPKQFWNTSLNYIAVVLLFALTFYIVRAFVRKEALWLFKKSKKSFETQAIDVEKNLESTDFNVLIENALHNDQPRLAVRYYYLWLLKILSKNEIIQWDLEKTNSDYLAEIKDEHTKKSFQYLSYLYNNIWYGEFDVDPAAFLKAQLAFTNFIKNWNNE